MNHSKKNSGNPGFQTPANRRRNQQAPPASTRANAGGGSNSENHPAQDPRLVAYYKHENEARFSRSGQQRPYAGNRFDPHLLRRVPWGPDAAYEENDMGQLQTEETLEDEEYALDRIRSERSRLLDDE